MFILDDIALSPLKGLMWIVREIQNAARQEVEAEAADLMQRLAALHASLESGAVDPDAFDREERAILDRLEEIDAMRGLAGADDDADDEDEEDIDDDEADMDAYDDELEDDADLDDPDEAPEDHADDAEAR